MRLERFHLLAFGLLLLSLAVSPPMAGADGLGSTAHARAEFQIPKRADAPTYLLPPGHLLQAGSLKVSAGSTMWRASDGGELRARTFRDLYGRGVLFSREDGGKRVVVEYDYRPARVALVRPVNSSDLDYLGVYLETVLRARMTDWGFSVSASEETQLALTSARIGLNAEAALTGSGPLPSATQVSRLAQVLGAEYILVSGVESIWGEDVALRTTLVLYDGDTGDELMRGDQEASEPLRRGWRGALQSTRSVRKSLIRVTVSEMLADHFSYRP